MAVDEFHHFGIVPVRRSGSSWHPGMADSTQHDFFDDPIHHSRQWKERTSRFVQCGWCGAQRNVHGSTSTARLHDSRICKVTRNVYNVQLCNEQPVEWHTLQAPRCQISKLFDLQRKHRLKFFRCRNVQRKTKLHFVQILNNLGISMPTETAQTSIAKYASSEARKKKVLMECSGKHNKSANCARKIASHKSYTKKQQQTKFNHASTTILLTSTCSCHENLVHNVATLSGVKKKRKFQQCIVSWTPCCKLTTVSFNVMPPNNKETKMQLWPPTCKPRAEEGKSRSYYNIRNK